MMKPASQMVRDFREKRGVTQTHVAKQAGITPQRLSQIETGLIRLTADELFKIVTEGFGVSLHIFFDEELSEYENSPAEPPTE